MASLEDTTQDIHATEGGLPSVPQGLDVESDGEEGLSSRTVGVIVLGLALIVGLIGTVPTLLLKK